MHLKKKKLAVQLKKDIGCSTSVVDGRGISHSFYNATISSPQTVELKKNKSGITKREDVSVSAGF